MTTYALTIDETGVELTVEADEVMEDREHPLGEPVYAFLRQGKRIAEFRASMVSFHDAALLPPLAGSC